MLKLRHVCREMSPPRDCGPERDPDRIVTKVYRYDRSDRKREERPDYRQALLFCFYQIYPRYALISLRYRYMVALEQENFLATKETAPLS